MHLTILLKRLESGDPEALDTVIPLVYDELKKLAKWHLRREAKAPPLQTTALVHETFLKLAGGGHPSYENRAHFFGIASRLMRQVLVDAARSKAAEKRAGHEVPLEEVSNRISQTDRPLLLLDDALSRLEGMDRLQSRLIEMHFFGGMTAEESSTALGISVHVVRRKLRLAQTWLRREMTETLEG